MTKPEGAQTKPLARLNHSLTYGNIWLSAMSIMKANKAYAYALPDEIERKFGFKPSKLMTYFILYKLEAEKLIFAKMEGRRKYYGLTPKGRKSLQEGKNALMRLSKKL